MRYRYIKSLTREELLSDGTIINSKVYSNQSKAYVSKQRIVKVAEGVTVIEKDAFARVYEMEEVYLPSSVEKICEGAFKNCKDLKAIHCSSPIVKVCNGVFTNDQNLEQIDMNIDINDNDIYYLFDGYKLKNRMSHISKLLPSFKLAKVENGVLTTTLYSRDEKSKVYYPTFSPVPAETQKFGFNEETREIFNLEQN